MRDLQALFNLAGCRALITGGAGHIGAAMADALAESGADIALLDQNFDQLNSVAQSLKERRGVKTLSIVVNLENEEELVRVPSRVVEKLGGLDIVINCAALVGSTGLEGWAVPVLEQKTSSWRRALEVNLTAPFVLAQASAPFLAMGGKGSIINVLSIYALVGPDERIYADTPLGNPAAYGASKAGLLQLTRHLATTLAPSIRCNAITPGGVARNQPAAFTQRYIDKVPLGRMAHEEDFKGAVAFLASPASAYITGQNIVVDGGWTAW